MKALSTLELDNFLFIDIETTALVKELTPDNPMWESWSYKMKYGRTPIGGEDVAKTYAEQASLYPEFGKVVCVTIGKIVGNVLKVKSYAGKDEKELLTNFCNALNGICNANKRTFLCGWAVKGFDIPWLMRRCIVNQIELPNLLDTSMLKPWESSTCDVMELWKSTGFNGSGLNGAAVALGLPNSKDEIGGWECSTCYWNDEAAIAKIQKYCEKDVLGVANVVRKCRYEPIVALDIAPIVEPDKNIPLLDKLFSGGKYTVAIAKQLTGIYQDLSDTEKQAMQLVLKSLISKNTHFTEKHLEAIVNFTPKTK